MHDLCSSVTKHWHEDAAPHSVTLTAAGPILCQQAHRAAATAIALVARQREWPTRAAVQGACWRFAIVSPNPRAGLQTIGIPARMATYTTDGSGNAFDAIATGDGRA